MTKGGASLVLLLLLPACAPRALVAPPTPHPAALEQIRRDLRAVFAEASANRTYWSVAVRSLSTGELLYGLNVSRLRSIGELNQFDPARPTSMARLAAARGADFRYTTRIAATRAIDRNGVLRGDLIVAGDGDPTIGPLFPDRAGVFSVWARQLAERGLRVVTGRLIGDHREFAGPHEGWSWADVIAGYGYRRHALLYRDGLVDIAITPSGRAGEAAAIRLMPRSSGLTVDNHVVTAADDTATEITVRRLPGSPVISVDGRLARDAAPVVRSTPVDDLTGFYLAALADALAQHGIELRGGTIGIDELNRAPRPAASTLIVDRSPPLSAIMATMERLTTAARATTPLNLAPPQSAADLSESEIDRLRRRLGASGIMERYLQSTATAGIDMVTPNAYAWLASMLSSTPPPVRPVSGAGNLAARLAGTPAEARVWARVGSQTANLRAVSGYLVTLDNEPLAFAMVVNNFRVPARQLERAIDAALVRLVAFSR